MNDIESFSMNEGSKMPHSHSTPAGVDGGSRTPPTTPRKAGKMLAIRVQMLDDTITMFQIQAKALGKVLFDQVCKQLHLLEADYFGLEYQEPIGTKYWLDLEKPLCRQVGLSLIDPLLRFCVKFYTPDPAQLEEEFTRYLFCLQIKRDLAQGLLQCNDNTAALMASYIVQAECGDYVIEDYPDHTYLSTYKFVPHQDHELERRIMENHKKHAGQSPAEADLNLLETARRCELYGMKMHPAKDHEGESLNLAVAHMGIVVYQHYTKINTFSWAKIRKISFKRKRFLIKLHPEGYGYYKDTVEFFFDGRNECKNFWKKCVENHGFFRCTIVKRVVRQKTRVLSRGSSFRYSGKTQKQIVEFVRDNYVKRQTFHRSNSFRQTSSGRALQGLEGEGYRGATSSSSLMGSSSISAHPLLPLGDPALATPALSLSCGSMTLDSPTTVTNVSAGGTSHRRDDTVMSFRTLTSIDVHSPATPSLVHAQRQSHATNQQRISSTGRISPSNSSPSDFPQPRTIPRHPWQRSASCRELYASSFEESGKARIKESNGAIRLPSQGELDNPVTRYNESNRSYSAANSKLPSLDHDFLPERVYSSSYPGTSSLSTESGHEESTPAGDLSHDDLSHDSYELLEREHECEYESYSSPHDDNDPMSDNSDEGIEPEMFQMDSETDSFVKLKLSKEKSHKKSQYIDHKFRAKSEEDFVIEGSKNQKSSTVVELDFESRSTDLNKVILQDVSKKQDPVILQVQKQKMTMLNELKNFKPKHKIFHVDSEVLRDEGIMRPKSRIDDDVSLESNKLVMEVEGKRRTNRAKSIASLEDQLPKQQVNTGSLGRGKSREKTDSKKWLDKETRRHSREEKKREFAREIQKTDRKSLERYEFYGRSTLRDFHYGTKFSERVLDLRELRRSIERLDSSERDDYSSVSDFFTKEEKLGLRELRKSLEDFDFKSYKSNRFDQHSFEILDSTELRPSSKSEYKQKHTLVDKSKPPRRKSADRLDSKDKPSSDFNPRILQFLDYYGHSFGRSDSSDRCPEKRNEHQRNLYDKKRSKKWNLLERKSFEYLDRSLDRKNNSEDVFAESRKYLEKSRSEDKPLERDDWRSLNKARKIAERRERELQGKLSQESRIDSTICEKVNYNVETLFTEYTPKIVGSHVLGFEDTQSMSHITVERTKSDPNPPTKRLGSNNKRHMLMHQKSIDLTPADSGDEDAFSEEATQKSNIEIPYTLHKRHIMNGTATEEKSESDGSKKNINHTVRSGKMLAKDLPKLPIKSIADVALDLSRMKVSGLINKDSTDKPKGILVSPDKPKSILSPSDKPRSILSPTSKLSPTDNKSFVGQLSPSNKSPTNSSVLLKSKILADKISKAISMDKKLNSPETITIITTDKKALKNVSSDTNVMIVSSIEKKRSPDSSYKSPTSRSPASKSPTSKSPSSRSPNSRSPNSRSPISKSPTNKGKSFLNFAAVVGMEITQELEKRGIEKLAVPDDSLEKQDSIEKIPLPEIPMKISESPKMVLSPVKTMVYEKPTIPEKTQRILDRIESKFTELNKNPGTRISRPKVIDTRYDDFVDPVADLPLDDVPVKPALELDSLKVPELSFMFRSHTESFRSKSLSLAEDKAPIDTLLSPEVENKHFLDVSPKKSKKSKGESKKDFQKQSKSLEGDKPTMKKSGSKELRTSPSGKIDKSKLKLNEMPQEIIVIDSTESIIIMPEVSIVQKGRSKSITRISVDKSFDENKQSKTKSASVDDEMIKSSSSSDKQRPKTLGISKSLSTTEKKDASPKKKNNAKTFKLDSNRSTDQNKFDPPLPPIPHKELIIKSPELTKELELADSSSSKQNEFAKTVEQVVNERKEIKKAMAGQEFVEPPVLRKPGQSPVLFARSRLGLSEGSGMGVLQRQGATQSPTSQRRAKSLDAPVVSLHKLPPANAFSSKDDTVDITEREENVDLNLQAQSKQATSSNRRLNDDAIIAPEAFTDSPLETEPSVQYFESSQTENNEIICSDLTPYEQEVELKSSNTSAKEPKLSSIIKLFANATFNDQSPLEFTAKDVKKENTEGTSSRYDSNTDNSDDGTPRIVNEVLKQVLEEKIEMPNVIVNVSADYLQGDVGPIQPDIDMVKSPIQISIEECSDNDIELSNSQDEEQTFHVETDDKKIKSDDNFDSIDTQVQMQGFDSESSSPDYLGDKTDEKTLVEMELTSEYLEAKKDDYDNVENLPDDEPSTKLTTTEMPDNHLLNVDKKLRLSAERSRSDETNTYTPDRDDPDSSSCSIARSLGIGQIQTISDTREIAQMRLARSFGSAEEESSSSAAPKLELTSTWRPFPLESSGSSSLEEGWIPQDESVQQIYSEDNADGNAECCQEDIADFHSSIGFPVGPEILASYGAFSLSRTLSRISERSTTSEQDKSELDDSFKPSSRSPSLDDESLISSDHQPSLSSDPPSGAAFPSVSEDRRTSSELPDIPIDVTGVDDGKSPKTQKSRLTLQSSEDWPSPPSSPIFDNTPIISHVETFYMDVRPEEAARVTVTDSTDTTTGRVGQDSDSDEENRTLHDDLHLNLLEEPSSASATIDGTVKIAIKPKSSSHSEDTSMGLSMSEWSSSNNTVRQFCQYSGTKSDDNSLTDLGASISDWSGSTTVIPQQFITSTSKNLSDTPSEKSNVSLRTLKNQTSIHLEEEEEKDIIRIEKREHVKSEKAETSFTSTFNQNQQLDENTFPEEENLEDFGFPDNPPPPQLNDNVDEGDYDNVADLPDLPEIPDLSRPIPEEDEDQYDNVPAMKYLSGNQIYMQVSRTDSGEDMHEKYARLSVQSRSGDDDWSFDDRTPSRSEEGSSTLRSERPPSRFLRDQGTKSTERPVMVPIRMKSSSYYSTTSLSGESTTSSPPMPIRTQIRTKTMPYSSNKSPQSEGDTSSSIDSPAHTPDRGQRAFRRKRQQRRHRVVVDLEIKDGQIVSSTDSSFDVSTIPPPLLVEPSLDDVESENVEYEMHESSGNLEPSQY